MRPQFRPDVQGLRAVAVMLVAISHAGVNGFDGGFIGVDIFFVISGFVMIMTVSPFRAAPQGWRYFAMRRVVRIVPMYWLATTAKILTLLVLPGIALRSALDPQHILFSYLFLPSRNEAGVVEPVLGVGWTLTFEMYFYAVFALALLLRVSPFLFAGSWMVAASIVGALLVGDTDSPWAVYLDRVVLYFVVGMAIGKLVQLGYVRWAPALVSVLLAVAVVLAVAGDAGWYRSSWFRFVIVSALVLAVVWAEPLLRGRVPSWLLFLGDASYSIYLFHPLVAPVVPELMARLDLRVGWLGVLGAMALALVVSCLIYVMVERRVLAWGRRLPYAGRIPVPGSRASTA